MWSLKTLVLAVLIATALAAPQAAPAAEFASVVQLNVLRWCKPLTTTDRRLAAALSLFPPTARRDGIIHGDLAILIEPCAGVVADFICVEAYVDVLQQVAEQIYRVPPHDDLSLLCGGVGAVVGHVFGDGFGDVIKGAAGGALICGLLQPALQGHSCERRKAGVAEMSAKVPLPPALSTGLGDMPVMMAIHEAFRAGRITTEERSLLVAEIAARARHIDGIVGSSDR
ncbi:hypothetical protein [Methylobrevis pamukkalensis]|uniref:Uncharacterized protein n=1 Tax=Methylobrevis pamukkalensis TaxID=1439726 RepID=A0A1E3H1F8_9HYPH|nr:hypothetical protein [Methylobrevis pamukkalensis]ODN70147.1 hypothetical protein A6302_02527 [Methylobrevis pamukkalensis]